MSYNTFTAQSQGGVQTARAPFSNTVLEAIGAEDVGGIAKPIDILLLQEQFSMQLTTQSFADVMNDLYDPLGQSMYARSTLNGLASSDFAPAPITGSGGRPGVVYNTETVELLGEFRMGSVGSSTSQQPRQTLLYHFRPVGYDSSADFYVYNSHYKADTGSDNNAKRLVEAETIRANADTRPEGTHIIYAGDFNIQSSSSTAYQHLLSSGNGQAFDPIDTPGSWNSNSSFKSIHTQSPAATGSTLPGGAGGGVDDRFDFQLVSGEFLDSEGLSYIPGSYHAFGNNGTHSCCNSSITTGTGASPTVLNALLNNSDHLPVVADYQLPAIMNASLAAVPSNVDFGSVVPIDVMVENIADVLVAHGADELDYTIDVSGSLSGGLSGIAEPLAGSNTHQVFLNTTSSGFQTGTVTVSATSQQAANSLFTFPISFTVGAGNGGPITGVIAKDTFDDSLNLVSFSQNPAEGAFNSAGDGFQVYQSGVSASIPFQLADDSNNGNSADVQGVVDTATKTDRWFGVTDTVNGDNLPVGNPGEATATWEFDVAGAFDLELTLDMAAMGDFEASGVNGDRFNWTYQFDDGATNPLFTSSIAEDASQDYALADGDQVTLNDPLTMANSVGEETTLSNLFTSITSPLSGTGQRLTVQLTVLTDGGEEGFAFDNLTVIGTIFVEFLEADFNQDGAVDSFDLAVWQSSYGLGDGADADGDGDTDGADFLLWQQQLGQENGDIRAASSVVPEPGGIVCLLLLALLGHSFSPRASAVLCDKE